MSSFIRTAFRVCRAFSCKVENSVASMRFVIAATALYWLASGRLLWFAVGVLCTALTYLPSSCIQDPALRAASAVCLSVFLLAHIVFGMQAGFYETSSVYDKVIHVLGCSAIAGLVIAAISQYCERKRIRLTLPLLLLFTIGTVVSLGTIWEMFEFALDWTGLFQTQRGLNDTMLDLMADMLGALVTIVAFALFPRHTINKTI